MGVDAMTYRIRIGCCRHIVGTDVVSLTVNINIVVISSAALKVLFLLLATFGILTKLQTHSCECIHEVSSICNAKVVVGTLYFIQCLSRKNVQFPERLIGAVLFIRLLLLAEGVEPNPGPTLQTWESMTNNDVCIDYSRKQLDKNVFVCGISFLSHMDNKNSIHDTFDPVFKVCSYTTNTLTNWSLTSWTCSYLLGNKGAHMTNGNPHNKGDVTVDPVRTLLEKEVHLSVGCIYVDKFDEKVDRTVEGFRSHGTGFRVGDCFMMTAYRVLRDRIEILIDDISMTISKKLKIDDLLNTLNMKHDKSVKTPRDAIKSFLKKNGMDVPLLMALLGNNVSEEFKSRETNVWKEHCVVDFLDQENKTTRFHVDWRIPFGCEEIDLLILKLEKIKSDQEMPPRLYLAEKYEQVDKTFIIRYMNKSQSEIVVDKECKVFTDDRDLEETVKTTLEWWTTIFQDKVDIISYEGCTKVHDINTGRIILRAAAPFVNESSGSPIVYFNENEYKGLVFVGMVYQKGFPIFYYDKEQIWDSLIKEKTGKPVNNDVLFEGCTTLQKLAELLSEYNKLDLKANIFDTKTVKRHYVKEQVTADLRSENYDELYDKMLTIPDVEPYSLTDLMDISMGECEQTEYMKLIVSQWKKDDKYFIETTASRHIYQEIETSNILTIVGSSGSGKSFCMHHVALKLQRQGYTLFVITDCCEIKQFMKSSDKKKLFLVDDPIGEDEIDHRKLEGWKSCSGNFKGLFTDSIKLMMTVRTELFNCLKNEDILFNIATANLHSEKLEMSSVEKDMFFREVVSKRNMEVPLDDPVWNMIRMCELHNFVMLVHMYCADEYYRQNPSNLFVEPLGAFEARLEQMWDDNGLQFGGLVLCSVYEDELPKRIFEPFDSKFILEKEKAKDLLEKLSIDCDLQLVGKELEKLQDVYINRNTLTYSFKHSTFKMIVLYVVAKKYINFIIDHCDTGFCLERCCLSRRQTNLPFLSWTKNDDKYKLEVDESTEGSLVSKLTLALNDNTDMVTNIFASSFCHDAQFLRQVLLALKTHLKDDSFRAQALYQIYCNACLIKAADIKEELKSFFDESCRPCFTGLTPLIACTYADDINHLKVLLTSNCDVNALGTGRYETTALCVASELGRLTILKLFLDHGADINQCDGVGRTPLTWSINNYRNDIFQFLIKNKADLNRRGSEKRADTPLIVASRKGDSEKVSYLLDQRAEVNKFDGQGLTPLAWAAYDNHIDLVHLLLKYNANVNLCGDEEESATPMHAACAKGYIDIIDLLLQHNADVNKLEGKGNTPITGAVFDNQIEVVHKLCTHNADINLCGDKEKSVTPLHVACRYGYIDILQVLIHHNADVNRLNGMGRTPITSAVIGKHVEVVQQLLSHNADVNLCGDKEFSYAPLHAACQYGYIDIIDLLLHHNADVNKLDGEGNTSLTMALVGYHTEAIRLLLSRNADVNLCGDKEECCTPLHAACALGEIDTVNLLLNHNADVNRLDGKGVTPITEAIYDKHVDVIQQLLTRNADVNLCGDNEHSFTPLHSACDEGYFDIIDLLLGHNADVNRLDGRGNTPLKGAVFANQMEVVQLLLSHNADVNLCGDKEDSSTPLFAACGEGFTDIIELLLDHGAEVDKLGGWGRTPCAGAVSGNQIEAVHILLAHDADVNLCGDKHQSITPLHTACLASYIDIIELLLQHNADVNALDGLGRTSITMAVIGNHHEVVKLLLKHNADVNFCGDKEQSTTSLHAASEEGYIDIIELLLSHEADVNKLDGEGTTPITGAVFSNQIEVVQLLLSHNGDVNLSGDKEESVSPLHAACRQGFVDILQVLINHKAEVNKLDGRGRTPITEAVFGNHTEVVQQLLTCNADVNLCGDMEDSLTPLHAACRQGFLDVLRMLMNHNVQVNTLDGRGRTPLTDAVFGNHIEILQHLLAHNADVNLRGDKKYAVTPLHAASQYGRIDILDLLLSHEADVNKLDGEGSTPMTCAVVGNHIEAVQFLLAKKADVNVCGNKEQSVTPLHAACRKGQSDIIRLLLDHNAEVNKLDGKGQTPIIAAVICGDIDVVKVLLERNADISICCKVEQSATPPDGGCLLTPLEIAHLLNNESMVDILQNHTKHGEPLMKKPRIL